MPPAYSSPLDHQADGVFAPFQLLHFGLNEFCRGFGYVRRALLPSHLLDRSANRSLALVFVSDSSPYGNELTTPVDDRVKACHQERAPNPNDSNDKLSGEEGFGKDILGRVHG